MSHLATLGVQAEDLLGTLLKEVEIIDHKLLVYHNQGQVDILKSNSQTVCEV